MCKRKIKIGDLVSASNVAGNVRFFLVLSKCNQSKLSKKSKATRIVLDIKSKIILNSFCDRLKLICSLEEV